MAICFISYARRALDERALMQVKDLLARARISFWWDGMLSIPQGSGLNEQIAGEIDKARVVVALSSSQSMSSTYCQAEIIYARQHDKPVIRVLVEPAEIPPNLLPLASARVVSLHGLPENDFEADFVLALAERGVNATQALSGQLHVTENILYHPDAAIIRPTYSVLKQGGEHAWQENVRRLNQAASLNADNPYNHLSLAFLWLYQRDAVRSLAAARKALDRLQLEADAHYAEALALCIQTDPENRTKAEVEAILRRLAVARRLPRAGAHIELLTAFVISNFYSPRYISPPVHPDAALRNGLAPGRRFDVVENMRVFDHEQVYDPAFFPDRELVLGYFENRS